MNKVKTELNHAKIAEDLVLNRAMALPQNGIPEWLPLVTDGEILKGRDGRTFKNPGASIIAKNQAIHGVDAVIDEEHSTELKAPRGESAPAFGWIREYREVGGEFQGKVEWTPKGIAALENKEYRYYSPAFRLSLPSRVIQFVKSVGLTNSPNLQLPALNHEMPQGGDELNAEKILKALGLNADASETDVLNAISTMKDKVELNHQNTKNMVPKDDYDLAMNRANKAETELNSLKETDLKDRATAAIEGAVKDGKIAPSSKEYYATVCNSEEALKNFEDHIGKAAPIVETNSEQAPNGKPPGQSTELNSEEKEMASQMGISEKDAKRYFGKEETK